MADARAQRGDRRSDLEAPHPRDGVRSVHEREKKKTERETQQLILVLCELPPLDGALRKRAIESDFEKKLCNCVME